MIRAHIFFSVSFTFGLQVICHCIFISCTKETASCYPIVKNVSPHTASAKAIDLIRHQVTKYPCKLFWPIDFLLHNIIPGHIELHSKQCLNVSPQTAYHISFHWFEMNDGILCNCDLMPLHKMNTHQISITDFFFISNKCGQIDSITNWMICGCYGLFFCVVFFSSHSKPQLKCLNG